MIRLWIPRPIPSALVLGFITLLSEQGLAQSREWSIVLVSGAEHRSVRLVDVQPDSLTLYSAHGRSMIPLDSIDMIHRVNGSYLGEGAALGFLGGVVAGAFLMPDSWYRPSGGHGFAIGSLRPALTVYIGLLGGLAGGIVGGFISRDERYVLISMTREEQFTLLEKLLFKDAESTP